MRNLTRQLAPKQPKSWAGEGRMHHKGKSKASLVGFSESKLKEKVGDVANKSELIQRRIIFLVPQDATFYSTSIPVEVVCIERGEREASASEMCHANRRVCQGYRSCDISLADASRSPGLPELIQMVREISARATSVWFLPYSVNNEQLNGLCHARFWDWNLASHAVARAHFNPKG